jgi:hypothetical protein
VTVRVDPFLAKLMRDYTLVWCPIHLMPYQAQWPLGAPAATLYLVEAAAEKAGQSGYPAMCTLTAEAPLCCWVDRSDLNGIYGKTVPL